MVIVDGEGYHPSTGIAEILASARANVTYVTAGYSPVSARLTDNWEERRVVKRLKRAGVVFRPTTWVRSISGTGHHDTHTHTHTGEEFPLHAAAVVLAAGRIPNVSLARELEGRLPQVVIGDALAARMFAAAPYEGQKFARLVGLENAPATTSEASFGPDDPALNLMPADVSR